MAEKQTKTVTINGTDYTEDQLTDQQKVMINHVACPVQSGSTRCRQASLYGHADKVFGS
jgi:hypothetical protein